MFRLIGLALCLFLTGAQDPADKIKALIEKLESEEIVVREEAAKELYRLGYDVLPALRKASEGSVGEKKRLLEGVISRLTTFGPSVQVTMEAKDRPLREIVADLQRQTRIPIRLTGAAVDAKATMSAKNVVIWKVIEDLCRARGDLMYRFKNSSVEIYPGKFRSLPSVDQDGLRVFIDRFVWDRDLHPHGSSNFAMQGAVLTPPGARVIWVQIVVEELRDDTGRDLTPAQMMSPMEDGDRFGLDSRRIIYPQTYRPPQGPPSAEANKFTRCRGKAVVMFAGGERVLSRVRDPLSAPSTPAPEGLPTFGVDRWKLRDGYLHLDFTVDFDAESVKSLPHKVAPFLVIRLKNGDWISVGREPRLVVSSEGAKPASGTVWIEVPDGAEIASLDVVVPDPVITVEVPFDFRDIPLK